MLLRGILVLSTPKRVALAKALTEHGVTIEDIDLLIAFIEESEPDPGNQRRFVVGLLGDAAKRAEAIANVRRYRACYVAKTAEFGASYRRGALEREQQMDLEFQEWVAQKKAAGEWPPRRDPHPWEAR